MIGALLKVKTVLVIAAVAFALGGAAGGGIIYKWAESQESARLKVAMELKEKEHAAAILSLQDYYTNLPPVEVIHTQIEEVIKYVPSDPVCNVSVAEHSMLNYARTGLQLTSPGDNGRSGETGAFGPLGGLPRSVEVRAHADAAVKYRECYAAAKAVRTFLLERKNP